MLLILQPPGWKLSGKPNCTLLHFSHMPWSYMDAGATGIIEIDLVPSMGTVSGFSLDAGVQSGMVVKTLWCPFPEAWYNGTISVISKYQ